MTPFEKILRGVIGGGYNQNDQNVRTPLEIQKADTPDNEIKPKDFMRNNDKSTIDQGNVYNDKGDIVGWNNFTDVNKKGKSNPLANALSAVQGNGMGNGQGSISGMIANFMGNNPIDVGSATGTDQLSGGTATTDQMSPKPMAPVKNYAQPSALPVESIPELRASLYTGAGLNPDLASPETTRGVIKGNLSDSEMTGMSTTDIPAGADPITFAKGLSQ